MDWKTAPSDEIVCNCRDIDKGTIVTAILGGVDTVAGIIKSTGAGDACGFCRETIQELINIYGEPLAGPPSRCCGSGCCS